MLSDGLFLWHAPAVSAGSSASIPHSRQMPANRYNHYPEYGQNPRYQSAYNRQVYNRSIGHPDQNPNHWELKLA